MERLIIETARDVLIENGKEAPTLTTNTDLLRDTSMDSMDLALLIIKLQERTGVDPFAEGFVEFHTVGELAALYGESK